MMNTGKGGEKKSWPRSWKHAGVAGGTLTLKGRGFDAEYAVVPVRVEAETPSELEDKVDDALADAAKLQRPS